MKDLVTSFVRNGTQDDHYLSPAGFGRGTLNPGFLVSVMFRDPEPNLRAIPPDTVSVTAPLVSNYDPITDQGWAIYRVADGTTQFNWQLVFGYADAPGSAVNVAYEMQVTVDPGVGDFITGLPMSVANKLQLWHFAFGVLSAGNLGVGRKLLAFHNGFPVPGGVTGSEFPTIATYAPAPQANPMRVLAAQLANLVGKGQEWFPSPLAIAGFGIAPLPVLAGETDIDGLLATVQQHTEDCFAQQDFANNTIFNAGANGGAYSARRGAYNLNDPWPTAERVGQVQGTVDFARTNAAGADLVAEATQSIWDNAILSGN